MPKTKIRRRGRDIYGVREPGVGPQPKSTADPYASIVHQALKPAIKITFRDGPKETIYINLEWVPDRWAKGTTSMPGWDFLPTKEQLKQIGGNEGGEAGGEDVIDGISMNRYEGGIRRGSLDAEVGHTSEYYSDVWIPGHRALKWEFVNDRAPEGQPDESWPDMESLAVQVVDHLLENNDDLMRRLVKRALQPVLKITFLDNPAESMSIPLKWDRNGYMSGGGWHPGLVPYPTQEQLRQIGGKIGGTRGGEWAMERIYSARYESQERDGIIDFEDENDRQETIRDTPQMYIRPLKWEYSDQPVPKHLSRPDNPWPLRHPVQ